MKKSSKFIIAVAAGLVVKYFDCIMNLDYISLFKENKSFLIAFTIAIIIQLLLQYWWDSYIDKKREKKKKKDALLMSKGFMRG